MTDIHTLPNLEDRAMSVEAGIHLNNVLELLYQNQKKAYEMMVNANTDVARTIMTGRYAEWRTIYITALSLCNRGHLTKAPGE